MASRHEIAAAAKKVSEMAEAATTAQSRKQRALAAAAQAQAALNSADRAFQDMVAAYDAAVQELKTLLA